MEIILFDTKGVEAMNLQSKFILEFRSYDFAMQNHIIMKSKFKEQKATSVEKFQNAMRKGEVDALVVPIIKYLNSLSDYYTTSSCAGRISVFHDVGTKKDSDWLGKWHHKVRFKDIKSSLKKIPKKGMVWLIYEPSIFHIVSRDLDSAVRIVNLARNSGFKKVGILSCKPERYLVEICSTERIDAPLAENGELLVNENYIKYLVKIANKKFQNGQKRLKRLEKALKLLE